jgi:hypothetical protein
MTGGQRCRLVLPDPVRLLVTARFVGSARASLARLRPVQRIETGTAVAASDGRRRVPRHRRAPASAERSPDGFRSLCGRVVEYPSWDLPDGLVEDVEEAAQRVEAEGVEYLEPGAVEDGRGSRVSCLSCGRLGACAGPHCRRSSISYVEGPGAQVIPRRSRNSPWGR